jgi:hypothetical protein
MVHGLEPWMGMPGFGLLARDWEAGETVKREESCRCSRDESAASLVACVYVIFDL